MIASKRHRIQFPSIDTTSLEQDEAYFFLVNGENGHPDDHRQRIRFHDYATIYSQPGLYEQLFYERLKCDSPRKVTEALRYTAEHERDNLAEMRVLDLGAGNGIMGEELKRHGVARLVGVDIVDEAREAAFRDRPHVYDDYLICDFTDLSPAEHEELTSWTFNALTCVAALGFGDIPVPAFMQGVNLLQAEGWLAFNIKETFLERSDTSGFSRLIRELIFSEYISLHHVERYVHRYSTEGKPMFYFAVICRKRREIPADFCEQLG